MKFQVPLVLGSKTLFVTGPMKRALNAAILKFLQWPKYACGAYRVDFQLT